MRAFLSAALMISIAATVWAAEPAARSGDAEAIRDLYAAYDAAWNKGDASRLATVWADDAEHMEPDGRVVKGRAAIEKEMAKRFDADLKGTHSAETITGIRFVTSDVAVVDAAYKVTGARGPQGQALPPLEGRYVDIWVEHAGRWHIAVDRPVVPAPAGK